MGGEMGKRVGVCLLLVSSVLSWAKVNEEDLKFSKDARKLKDGTYIGYIAMDGETARIPAVLDVVPIGPQASGRFVVSGSNTTQAILRTSLGGFRSSEYVAQSYLIFHHKDLILDGVKKDNGPDTSFVNAEISDDGSFLRAQVRTVFGGPGKGVVKMLFQDGTPQAESDAIALFEERPYIPLITGDYYGKCNGAKHMLQLEASRRYLGEEPPSTPLFGYVIGGRWGVPPPYKRVLYALEDNAPYTQRASFDDVSINFYKQTLRIPSLKTSCKMERKYLICRGDCEFEKNEHPDSVSHLLYSKGWKRAQSKKEYIAPPSGKDLTIPFLESEVEGDYVGYLHLEDADTYERLHFTVSMNHTTAASAFAGKPYIGISGSVFVCAGPMSHSAFVPFRFEHAMLPTTAIQDMILDGQKDPIIRIAKWTQEGLIGTWYSRSYGRIGKFSLKKAAADADLPDLPALNAQLEGEFRMEKAPKHHEFFLNIAVSTNSRLPAPSTFPFNLGGFLLHRRWPPATANLYHEEDHLRIDTGSYDPFTRVVSLDLQGRRRFLGRVTMEGLEGYISTQDERGRGLEPQDYKLFRFIK